MNLNRVSVLQFTYVATIKHKLEAYNQNLGFWNQENRLVSLDDSSGNKTAVATIYLLLNPYILNSVIYI